MLTYQDLVALGDDEQARMAFVRRLINEHQSSEKYKTAKIADEYARHRNTTIMNYQKLLYTLSGNAVPDNWSANYKIPSNFFYRFVTQQNQYLLGNGVTWEDDTTKDKLGEDFDIKLQQAGQKALIGGVSFGFYNLDHVDVFSVLEFAPLYDEENGALMAGARFWQIDPQKPLRATLYEIDGYTDYIWHGSKGDILHEKMPYVISVTYSEADKEPIYDGRNYPTFPIVPLYGNPYKQSEIIGIREQIDAYDLIKSGFANDLDDASQIYWVVQNAGGMDDIDLAQFVQRIRTVHGASLQEGQTIEAHTLEVPYSARESILNQLRKDLYCDYMALNVEELAGEAVTAKQIQASYEPVNNKTDQYEYCVLEFVKGILAVAGIEDHPTFTRSVLVDKEEEITLLVSAGEFLHPEYVTRRILTLLGDADKADEMLEKMAADEIDRGYNLTEPPQEPKEPEDGESE